LIAGRVTVSKLESIQRDSCTEQMSSKMKFVIFTGAVGEADRFKRDVLKPVQKGASAGRAGNLPRSPYPSKVRSVDPATVHGRRLRLPQEICPVSVTD
jgi:hypothetical protein